MTSRGYPGYLKLEGCIGALRARPETRSGRVQVPYRADRRPDFRCATGTLSPPRDPFDITRPAPSEFPDGLLVLLCHEVLEAAGTSGKASGESVCQVEAQGCDRGLNVALRSEGERPGDGSSREGEVPGGSPSVNLRGEPGLAARPEIHTPRCTGRHDGGTRASPAPRSGPAPSPA